MDSTVLQGRHAGVDPGNTFPPLQITPEPETQYTPGQSMSYLTGVKFEPSDSPRCSHVRTNATFGCTHGTFRCLAVTVMCFRHLWWFMQNSNTNPRLEAGGNREEPPKNLQLFPRKEEPGVQVEEMAPMVLLVVESIGSHRCKAAYATGRGQ